MLKKMARKYMQLPEDQGGFASLLSAHQVAVVMSNIPPWSAFQCAAPATCTGSSAGVVPATQAVRLLAWLCAGTADFEG